MSREIAVLHLQALAMTAKLLDKPELPTARGTLQSQLTRLQGRPDLMACIKRDPTLRRQFDTYLRLIQEREA